MESLFSDEGVAVRLAGPVVRAGSLLLSGGSGGEQSRVQGTCPGCSALGLWALGSGSSQALVEQAWLNAHLPVCLANCGHGVFPLEAQVDGLRGMGLHGGLFPGLAGCE